ncbi:hypothetical protein P9112_006105 [Eukaryota sp. TZLM1-RC]
MSQVTLGNAELSSEVIEFYESLFSDTLVIKQQLNVPPGGPQLEYKSYIGGHYSLNTMIDDFTRYGIAFLNTSGGLLIGGISHDDHSSSAICSLDGVALSTNEVDYLHNTFAQRLSQITPANVLLRNHISIEAIMLHPDPNIRPTDRSDSDEELLGHENRYRYLIILNVAFCVTSPSAFKYQSVVYLRDGTSLVSQSIGDYLRCLNFDKRYVFQQDSKIGLVDYGRWLSDKAYRSRQQGQKRGQNRQDPYSLPIHSKKDEIIQALKSSRIVTISAETGSGKSTQLAKMILDDAAESNVPLPHIVVSQQRRVPCYTLARRVSNEWGLPFPSLIGYHIGGDACFTSDCRIKFVTNGVCQGLLKSILSDQNGSNQIDVLIFDEVHNRDVDGELCLTLCKFLLAKKPSLRIVLMSATLPTSNLADLYADQYVSNFNPNPNPNPMLGSESDEQFGRFYSNIPSRLHTSVQVSGRKFEIFRYYLDDPLFGRYFTYENSEFQSFSDPSAPVRCNFEIRQQLPAFVEGIIKKKLFSRHFHKVNGILIFLPGMGNINELADAFATSPIAGKIDVCMLHSSLSSEDNEKALKPKSRRRRNRVKVILATNIAESSLTIPDINIVIDTCVHKEVWYKEAERNDILVETWASRQLLTQREGRVGRLGPGVVVRMIPKFFYDNCLLEESKPMTLRVSLTRLVLSCLNIGVIEPEQLLQSLPAPPNLNRVSQAYNVLIREGVIVNQNSDPNHNSHTLSPMGRVVLSVPLSIKAAKMAFYGCCLGLGEYAIIAACISDRKSPIKTPMGNPAAGMKSLLNFSGGARSDLVAGVNAYLWFIKNKGYIIDNLENPQEIIGELPYFLSLFWLQELHDVVIQVRQEFSKFGLVPQPRRSELFNHRITDTCHDAVTSEVTSGDHDDVSIVDDDSDEDLIAEGGSFCYSQVDNGDCQFDSMVSDPQISDTNPNPNPNLDDDIPVISYSSFMERCAPLVCSRQVSETTQSLPIDSQNDDVSKANRKGKEDEEFVEQLDFVDDLNFNFPYLTIKTDSFAKTFLLQIVATFSFSSNVFRSLPLEYSGSDIFVKSALNRANIEPKRVKDVTYFEGIGKDATFQLKSQVDSFMDEGSKWMSLLITENSFYRQQNLVVLDESGRAPGRGEFLKFDPPFFHSPITNLLFQFRETRNNQGNRVQCERISRHSSSLNKLSSVFNPTQNSIFTKISLANPGIPSTSRHLLSVVSATNCIVTLSKKGKQSFIYMMGQQLPLMPNLLEKLFLVFYQIKNSEKLNQSSLRFAEVFSESRCFSLQYKCTKQNSDLLHNMRDIFNQVMELSLNDISDIHDGREIRAEDVFRLIKRRERNLCKINPSLKSFKDVWQVFLDFFDMPGVFVSSSVDGREVQDLLAEFRFHRRVRDDLVPKKKKKSLMNDEDY